MLHTYIDQCTTRNLTSTKFYINYSIIILGCFVLTLIYAFPSKYLILLIRQLEIQLYDFSVIT